MLSLVRDGDDKNRSSMKIGLIMTTVVAILVGGFAAISGVVQATNNGSLGLKPFYVNTGASLWLHSASEGGMEMLTKTVALEVADKGIRINGIAPDAIAITIKDLENVYL